METSVAQCPQCGERYEPGKKFCGECGAALSLPRIGGLSLPQTAPSAHVTSEYRCPYCGTTHPPQLVKRLSTVGWFVLLGGLLFFLVGALFALFFMQEWRMCPVCRKVFY